MKAFTIVDPRTGTLYPADMPVPPAPTHNQVRLALIGTSINPIDPLVAKGYGAPLLKTKRQVPLIPGRDAVARVVDVGKGVTDLRPGQRVLVAASPRTGGTYAEIFNLPRKCVAPIEDSLSDATAAGLGYAGLTALQALAAADLTADNARGKHLCINGASGGVGSIALVLARRWGATITAVASQRNQDWVRCRGADQTVDYRDPDAMAAIDADIILNFAAPGDNHRQDPLLDLLRRRDTPGRAYVNTTNPVLSSVTDKGVVGGLTTSGGIYLKKRLAAHRAGIRYRWVLFQENAEQLAYLARVFADPDTPTIVSDSQPLDALPEAFNDPKGPPSPGKGIFMVEAP
ncbi:alcohol dehydrogenase catalytic domain-containing protein [Alloalcanivorax xenomutans]|uniref:alcohol dehydrogenase catalytic domain-containing protein n=1 Tax=Alloalcanivorax xenomutans TaxID=1094342 RepID=UPI00047D9DF1